MAYASGTLSKVEDCLIYTDQSTTGFYGGRTETTNFQLSVHTQRHHYTRSGNAKPLLCLLLRTVKAASRSRRHTKGKKPLGYRTYYLCKTAFLLFLLHMYVFLKY